MESKSLQDLVKNVFSDEKTKLEFIANPESVLSRFALTDQEKRALLATHARLGLLTGDTLQLEEEIDPFTFWY